MAITKRQRNYNKLKEFGFLPFEARELTRRSRIIQGKRTKVKGLPLNTPYILEMVAERKSALKVAQKIKLPKSEWIATIKDMYIDKGWLHPITGRPDAWQMVRANEDRYKREHPEYDPDYPEYKRKKPKTKKLFDELYEAGRTKYPRGAHYR